MAALGVCCVSLKDNKALMKMGLGLVLVGHINFLLGALAHGAVLRHINVHAEARIMVFAVSNVVALVAGLLGIISGVLAIVLSKNKKSRILQWVLLVFSIIAALLAVASTLGLFVSMVTAILHKGRSLLTHCTFKNQDVDSSSITYECPFDPTRIYGTIIVLWVLLILMCVTEAVFSFRCFAACTSFLYLCPCRRKPIRARRVRIQRAEVPSKPPPQLSDSEVEAPEQEDLLDGGAAAAQSQWL